MIAEPTLSAARARLADFVPLAGSNYARLRNFDLPAHPHVSVLSPYVRHRALTEAEVVTAVLDTHSSQAAEKFVSEVFWRTYWKGWLEMRPAVWQWYQADLHAAYNRLQTESGLRQEWEAACKGDTGIDCFDHWARELADTGYLHNHARMWFASIWVFTLRLPWALGADFFLRHLLDGDPASNTLSWRWVSGLQTKGKTYLATPSNIAKYTDGRFQPKGLASHANALSGSDAPAPRDVPQSDHLDRDKMSGLLVHHDDLSASFCVNGMGDLPSVILDPDLSHGPLKTAASVVDFRRSLAQDASPATPVISSVNDLIAWAKNEGITQLVTPYAPVGPVQDWLDKAAPELTSNGITLVRILRGYDKDAWPHATKGFFPFKKHIPDLVSRL
ncbi:FAD-binding domain-containing protein [Yoonia sp. 208BN28-4]|uniref:FAD-binding domain-containing protein n=1 Tax=Yoonia sp. 208BN28-4 TaxID=3126505 RepID=UPI0030964B8E